MNPEKAVLLKVYPLLSSAETAFSCLQACGIECLIRTDDFGGMLSPLNLYEGVKLVVDADQAEQAREILAALEPVVP